MSARQSTITPAAALDRPPRGASAIIVGPPEVGFGREDDDEVPSSNTGQPTATAQAPALEESRSSGLVSDLTDEPELENVEHATLTLAFLAAQREFEEIVKDKEGKTEDGRTYGYASLPNVINALRPVVNRHGIIIHHPTRFITAGGQPILVCTATLIHAKTGETLTADWPIASGLIHPKALAARSTMARRYATLTLLGAAPEELDGDGDALEPEPPADAPPPPQQSDEGSAGGEGGDALVAGVIVSDAERATLVASLAPTPPEVVAVAQEQSFDRHSIDERLNKVETEADLDAIIASPSWHALPRKDRTTFEDKAETIREQIKAGGGTRTPPKSRRAFLAERATTDAEQTDTAQAALFVKLKAAANKQKSVTALSEWMNTELSNKVLASLTDAQRADLEKTCNTKRDKLMATA